MLSPDRIDPVLLELLESPDRALLLKIDDLISIYGCEGCSTYSKSTRATYLSALRAIFRPVLFYPVCELHRDFVIDQVTKYDRIYSAARVSQMRTAHRRFCEWAYVRAKIELPHVLPKRRVGRPRKGGKPTTFDTATADIPLELPQVVINAAKDILSAIPAKHLPLRHFLDLRWSEILVYKDDILDPETKELQSTYGIKERGIPSVTRFRRESVVGDALVVLKRYCKEGHHKDYALPDHCVVMPNKPGGTEPVPYREAQRLFKVGKRETFGDLGWNRPKKYHDAQSPEPPEGNEA